MEIGSTIKQLRKKKDINQNDFGKLCGISQTSLSQIETGTSRPSTKNLTKICEVLEIPEYLLYLLSIHEDDIDEGKRDRFRRMFPTVKSLMLDLFYEDQETILE